jgi:hypothetical protein
MFASFLSFRRAVVRPRLQREIEIDRLIPVEGAELVLRERLGRIEIQRARVGVVQDLLDDRDVVAEGLSARRARHHDDVPAGAGVLDRRGLVEVELFDPLFLKDPLEAFVRLWVQKTELRFPFGEALRVRELPRVEVRRAKVREKLIDFHELRFSSQNTDFVRAGAPDSAPGTATDSAPGTAVLYHRRPHRDSAMPGRAESTEREPESLRSCTIR